jgi:hypothetical protein
MSHSKAKVDQRRMVDDKLTRLDFVLIYRSAQAQQKRASVQIVADVFVFFMTTFAAAGLTAMTDLAGCFFGYKGVPSQWTHARYGRSCSSTAGPWSVDLRKTITLMAVETTAFENKTATPVQTVALSALHARNRRMLVKRLKSRRRIQTNKEMHFLLAALP